jgi:hypothetical protein
MKFQQWFNEKLKVTRYPTPTEIKKSGAKYVINVSCEYISSCQKVCMENGIKYFWFPMDEVSGDIGVNSIFGALQILWIAEQEKASVILHCHAGANRSPTVMEAYYFMRTKKHLVKVESQESKERFKKMFIGSENFDFNNNNRLLNNIEAGHLPCKNKMEVFLKKTEEWFLKQDWENDFITESGLNSAKHESHL